MVSICRTSAANEARLLGNRFNVITVANATWCRQCQYAFVDSSTSATVFASGATQCTFGVLYSAACSAELMSLSSAVSRSRRAADATGSSVALGEVKVTFGRRPPAGCCNSDCPGPPLRRSFLFPNGPLASFFGAAGDKRSGASRSSSPAIPINVNSAYDVAWPSH